MTLAVVIVHYRMPEKRLRGWLAWNAAAIEAAGAEAWIISDVPREDMPPWAHLLTYPGLLAVFSLTKTANYGIRRALDAGAGVVMKTDADCILSRELLAEAAAISPGRGLCPRYWMADGPDAESLRHASRSPQLIGTLALHADDWRRICGYRETMSGYGVDDCDVRDRALQAGISVPLAIEPRLYHVAHDAGACQIGSRREDQWGRADGFNPKNHSENLRQKREPWACSTWGMPEAVAT